MTRPAKQTAPKVAKLSISLPVTDIELLDSLVDSGLAANRSSAVHRALEHLREAERERHLLTQYAAADHEWRESGEAHVWSHSAGDGT